VKRRISDVKPICLFAFYRDNAVVAVAASETTVPFFLVPGLPDDVICFAGGLTDIPLWQLIVLAVVGRAPAFFLVNVVGNLLGTDNVPAAVGLAVILVVVSVLGYRNRNRLVRFF